MRLTSNVIGLLAFALAALLSVLGAFWAAKAIEEVSERSVRRALTEEGFTFATAEADGLRVVISGQAPSEAQRFRALGVAGSIIDAGRVIDAMTVPDPAAIRAPDFSVEILRNDDGISLIGLIPAETGRDGILGKATVLAPGNVTDMLETANHPAPDHWGAALDYALSALKDLPRSKISVSAARIAIAAITDSAEQKAQLEQRLRRSAPSGVVLSLDVSAPRPVITPFILRFLIDEGGARFDACSADTVKARARILAAARAASAPDSSACTIGMGVPSPAWATAAEKSIAALAELKAGSVTMSDADISLIAADSVSQADFDRVVGELDAALPDVFSLTAVLTPKPKAVADQGPPELTAVRSTEGRVQIRGRLPDELTRSAVENFARARFGTGSVYVATRLDSALPDGWPQRALAAVEALSRIESGSVVVQPGLVRVEGVTGSTETGAAIARLLAERLGEGQEFDIRVRYDAKLDPLLALPSGEECIARIHDSLAKTKINFEPGSATLTPDTRAVIDAVAADLKDCADFPIEVAGHTDAQGGEEMNLALSEDRAEAVVDALRDRRVLVSNLHPAGYGETRPIADNGTEAGREANRRIEFTLLDEEALRDAETAAAAGDIDDAQEEPAPGDASMTAPTVDAGPAAGETVEPAGSGDDIGPGDDIGSGDEIGPDDGMDTVEVTGPGDEIAAGDDIGSGDEIGPGDAAPDEPVAADATAATGEPAPGADATATPEASGVAPGTVLPDGLPPALMAATDSPAAKPADDIVIEVLTPDRNTIRPKLRPASVEAAAEKARALDGD